MTGGRINFFYVSTFITRNSSGYSRALKLTNWLTLRFVLAFKYMFLCTYFLDSIHEKKILPCSRLRLNEYQWFQHIIFD